jgi:hypothetical protein
VVATAAERSEELMEVARWEEDEVASEEAEGMGARSASQRRSYPKPA